MLGLLLGMTGAAAIYFVVLFVIVRQLAAAPLWWRILGWSGVPLSFSGLGFASRFWNPSAGPYVANRLYPFGGHLQAWAVSFGFTWVALGLLFSGAVSVLWRDGRRFSWTLLLSSWILCWWPHGIIAIAFAWNGANRQSIHFYQNWASNPIGFTVIVVSSILLMWHFTFSIVGFIATGRSIFRRVPGERPSRPHSPGVTPGE